MTMAVREILVDRRVEARLQGIVSLRGGHRLFRAGAADTPDAY